MFFDCKKVKCSFVPFITTQRAEVSGDLLRDKAKKANQVVTVWDRENSRMVMSSLCSFKRPYLVASQISVPPPVASGHLLKILIPGPCPKLSESESPEMEFGNPHFLNKRPSRLGNRKSDIHKPLVSADRSLNAPCRTVPWWPASPRPRPQPQSRVSSQDTSREAPRRPLWLPGNAQSLPLAAGVRGVDVAPRLPSALAGTYGLLGLCARPGRGHPGGDDGGSQLYGAIPDEFPTCLVS